MADSELAALAASQEGLVTRIQARDHLSREQLKHRLAAGRLVPVRWGVYRFAGVPPTRWQELRAACLAAGPGTVASHRTAAVVWEMSAVAEPEHLEITAPWPQWPRLPGVRTHQSSRLPLDHCTVQHGVPVTSVARTLVDLSQEFDAWLLGRVVDDCVRRHLVSLDTLHAVYAWLAKPGRHGMAAIAEVLARRPTGFKPGDSAGELDVAEVLVQAGLPRPAQQHQVVAGATVYLLDHSYPDRRIAIEYDDWTFHHLPSDLDKAAERDNALRLAGWMVLHFTRASGAGRIVRDVRAALRAVGVSDLHLRGKPA